MGRAEHEESEERMRRVKEVNGEAVQERRTSMQAASGEEKRETKESRCRGVACAQWVSRWA